MCIETMKDIAYSNVDPACTLDVYLPVQDQPGPMFLYLHGGGLEAGDKALEAHIFDGLLQRGIAVASANYRMYPQARFPQFVEDAAAAAAYVRKTDFGRTFSAYYLGGSSAGAYLAMMLLFDPHYLGQHGIRPNAFTGYLLDAGQPTAHYNVLREREQDTRLVRLDDSAPLYFVGSQTVSDSPLPRIHVICDENDMPGRVSQNRLLLDTLRHFEYPEELLSMQITPGYGHTGYLGVQLSDGQNLFSKMAIEFILGDA